MYTYIYIYIYIYMYTLRQVTLDKYTATRVARWRADAMRSRRRRSDAHCLYMI